MSYRLSNHAREQAKERNIPQDLIDQILRDPDPNQIKQEADGRWSLQGKVILHGREKLLRLIVAFEKEDQGEDVTVVVTVYATTVGRYGSV